MTTLTTATPAIGGAALGAPLPRTVAAPPTAGLSAGDVWRIIRHRLILILVVWFLLIGATVAFTFLMIRYYPVYRATAFIRVQSVAPMNVMNPLERQQVQPEEIERAIQDQVVLVKSPQVIADAIKDVRLRETSWYKEANERAKAKNEDVVDLLLDILAVAPVRDTNYVAVTASWRVPSEVAVLVNTVVEKYLAAVDKSQKEDIRESEEQLGQELERAKNLYENKQRELETFLTTAEFVGKPGEGANETLATLRALVTELEIDLLGRQSTYEQLANARPEELPITQELQNLLRTDPSVYQAEQALVTTNQIYNELRARFMDKHRIVNDARLARDAAAERAQEERAKRILRYQQEMIETARRNWLEAQEQLLQLKEKLQTVEAAERDNQSKVFHYDKLREEIGMLKLQYEQLMEQKHTLSILLRQKKTVQIDVRASAVEPKRRSSPRWEIWLPAGTVLGMAIAVGLALLLELSDTSVRTPRDVLRQQLAVLGTIPITDEDEVEIPRVETASIDAPHSIVAEAFRNLRANLFFSAPAEQQGAILVTSPSGGNGKTTVATNLAIAIALSGRRVLLIDANFRRPALPRIFPNVRPDGLSNILIGQGRLDEFVTETSVPGLDVLSSGPTPPNPAELLGSSYLRETIADARARYDQVIFDGPPVLLVSDAIVLAGAVDGVLLVCQYRATSRGALSRTQQQLDATGARIFGAVLNMVESRAGGYFRKSYREFYDYHEAEEEVEKKRKRPKLEAEQAAAAAATAASAAELAEGTTAEKTEGAVEAPRALDVAAATDAGAAAEADAAADLQPIDLAEAIESLNGEHLLGEDELAGPLTPDELRPPDDESSDKA